MLLLLVTNENLYNLVHPESSVGTKIFSYSFSLASLNLWALCT